MKIMYDYQILWLQEYGGISRYFYEISQGIDDYYPDAEIDIPTAGTNNHYFKQKLSYRNWKRKWMERIADEILTSFKVIFSRIKGSPYNIIHFSFYLPLLWDRFIDRKRSKVVVTVYDMTHEKFMKRDKRLIKNKLRLMEKADGIIAISENTKKDILQIYPHLQEKKIAVIYLGNSLAALPSPFHIPKQYVLYVGNREGYKNFELLLEAFFKLKEKDTGVQLICAGGGEFQVKEKRRIEQYGLSGNVNQLTVDDEKLSYLYQNAACMVFPSLYEGFGIPILEAFYWKCPVLLSNCSCFPEIAGDAAVYFDGNDSEDLYRKMQSVIYDAPLQEKLVEKGLKQLERYSWIKTANETYQFYRELVEAE